jgi:hypothetical protein
VAHVGETLWKVVVAASARAIRKNAVAQAAVSLVLARAAWAASRLEGARAYCDVNGCPMPSDQTAATQ